MEQLFYNIHSDVTSKLCVILFFTSHRFQWRSIRIQLCVITVNNETYKNTQTRILFKIVKYLQKNFPVPNLPV